MGLFDKLFKKEKKPTLMEDINKASKWISMALKSSGYNADFSLESLREIDRFYDEQNCPGGLLSTNVGSRLFSIGAYIGTVIVKETGGKWITDDDHPEGEIYVEIELPDGSYIQPVIRAMKRYQNGSEDGIYAYGYVICKK